VTVLNKYARLYDVSVLIQITHACACTKVGHVSLRFQTSARVHSFIV